ncbi:TonB-dependent receptor [Hymenobacter arizonensis]|uniref:Outer membrane receptor proteins, mostly Fe transport n=1 Tax=Hymenobacter arizonensis TaxID=1227077 RepID=A0A1I6BQM5_HYMAR|nr:carboxypeptidase-like regulatory domain-containing protein [Hymenobacter arizonensis]SFQ83223.1 Outer membrane receptor proteins, mostly Fe transport [Hymenobacter arizonensis]
MRFILFVFIVLALGLSLPVHAQGLSQTIRGRILDRESQQPLIGATVLVVGSSPLLVGTADVNGDFKIPQVPVGRHTLKISFVGYEEQTIPELLLGSGKELVLNIGLGESFTKLNEVTVTGEREKGTARNDMATVSARSISVEESKRYAASLSDPARTAQTLAGVSGTSGGDLSNEIVVRGNSPRGLLWRIEGVEAPNPNHFSDAGASGGAVSVLSTNALANSDFFTAAFPAEYGNALSGVFDVRLRAGNNQKREYAFQAGVLGVEFALEGPFSARSKASYLVNYRYSSLALLNNLGVDVTGDGSVPKYQDLSFKVNVPVGRHNLVFWGIGGLSSNNFVAARDSSIWKSYFDRFDGGSSSDVATGGLTYTHVLNDRAYLETALTASGDRHGYQGYEVGEGYRRVLDADQQFVNTALRGSLLYNYKLSARHTLRAGAVVSRLGFDARSGFRSDDYGGQFVQFLQRTGAATTTQAYGQWKYRATKQLTVTSGVHFLRFGLNGNTALEPRVGARWAFSPKQSLSAGAGLHSRLEAPFVYFTQLPQAGGGYAEPNRNLGLARALHYVLGYDNLLREDLRLRVEPYYQYLYDVAISPNRNSTFAALNFSGGAPTEALVARGKGQNYGLDVTLEKFFTGQYYFQLTGSLYDSRYQAADGKWRNTRYNGNFVANALGGREFKVGREHNNLVSLNLRLLWAGGNRYTPVDLDASRQAGYAVLLEDRAWAEQGPGYFRLDLRASYRNNRPRASHIISLDIQNVTNNQNIFGRFYDRYSQQLETSYQTSLVPFLNYRVEF